MQDVVRGAFLVCVMPTHSLTNYFSLPRESLLAEGRGEVEVDRHL